MSTPDDPTGQIVALLSPGGAELDTFQRRDLRYLVHRLTLPEDGNAEQLQPVIEVMVQAMEREVHFCSDAAAEEVIKLTRSLERSPKCNPEVQQMCRAHLVRASVAVAAAISDPSASTRTCAALLKLMSQNGLVGWCDGKRPSRYCFVDEACARAVASKPNSPFLERLSTLRETSATAEPANHLLKQLSLALGHPSHLHSMLEGAIIHILGIAGDKDPDRDPDEILVLTRTIDGLIRYQPHDLIRLSSGFWSSKVMAKVLALAADPHQKADTRSRILGLAKNLSDQAAFRMHLLDAGLVRLVIGGIKEAGTEPNRLDRVWTGCLMNLSRSEALHSSLRDQGLLEAMELMVAKIAASSNPEDEVGGDGGDHGAFLGALLPLAHVFGSEASNHPAQQLLSKYDVSKRACEILSTAIEEGKAGGCSVEEAQHAVQALSGNSDTAVRMMDSGILPMLHKVLSGARAPSPDDPEDVIMKAARTCLNMSYCKSYNLEGVSIAIKDNVTSGMIKVGIPEALLPLTTHSDSRIADAAKGTLLNLGLLKDDGVSNASGHSLERVKEAISGGTAAGSAKPRFDVFLSHKRTDAKDFARALYNLLVLRGFTTFLDFEYREELSRLDEIVGRCTNFIFVLTDNVFDSPWCMKELQAAVEAKVNIVLLVKDGARWKDHTGAPVCNFPPYDLINSLPAAVHSAFDSKAITHSDEYYQAFIDTLIPRLKSSDFPPEPELGVPISSPVTSPTGQPQQPQQQQQQLSFMSPPAVVSVGISSDVFQAEVAAIRREMSAEVASLSRNVSEQMAAMERGLRDQMQAQERSLTSQLQQQALMLSGLVQGMQGLQLALMQQVSQLSAGHATELQQARNEISSEVLMMQRLRQEIEGQAASVRESQATISRDVAGMREGLQAALTGFAGSIAAYSRNIIVGANGSGASNGSGDSASSPSLTSKRQSQGHKGLQGDGGTFSPSGAAVARSPSALPQLGVRQGVSSSPHGTLRIDVLQR